MGLDDIVKEKAPDDSQSTSSRTRRRDHSDSDKYFKVVGKPPLQKVFQEEEDWKETAEVLRDEMGYMPNEVLNMPAEKRFELLHEARLWNEGELEEMKNKTEDRCAICKKACTGGCVEINGINMHVSHTVGELNVLLEEKENQ